MSTKLLEQGINSVTQGQKRHMTFKTLTLACSVLSRFQPRGNNPRRTWPSPSPPLQLSVPIRMLRYRIAEERPESQRGTMLSGQNMRRDDSAGQQYSEEDRIGWKS